MTVSETDIIEVVDAVWRSMLGIETHPVDGPEPAAGAPVTTASVLISGAFEGGVTLELPSDAGSALAALMFGMDEADVSGVEIVDAVGELANMIGGNLKALVPQPARLSLPSVAEGESYTMSFPGTAVTRRVAVGFGPHVLRIALHSRVDGQPITSTENQRSVA
jgi:chemotaxis protein CheX